MGFINSDVGGSILTPVPANLVAFPIQNNAPVLTSIDGKGMHITGAVGTKLRYAVRTIIPANFEITAQINAMTGQLFNTAGIVVRNSVDGDSYIFGANDVGNSIAPTYWSSDSIAASSPVGNYSWAGQLWIKIIYTLATNSINFLYSTDGYEFHSRIIVTPSLVNNPDQIGIGIGARNATFNCGQLITSYDDGLVNWNCLDNYS